MIKEELIFIDLWYPWDKVLIAEGKKYKITEEVNNILYDIYESNHFSSSKVLTKGGMPKGPYEIKIKTLRIRRALFVEVVGIKYMGLDKLKTTIRRSVRWHIKNDRLNAREWLAHEKKQRILKEEENATVGHIKKQGVKNKVINWEKMLQRGK